MAIRNKVVISVLFTGIFVTSLLSTAVAQRRISYEQLAQRQRIQSIFFDSFSLPGSGDKTVKYVTTFRVDYNLLPFKKVDNASPERRFFSTVGMGIEIFKAGAPPDSRDRRRAERRDRDDLSVKGLEPVDRSMWTDTAYAENYAQTKSNNRFVNGKLVNELEPGNYRYILQLIRGEEVDGERSRTRFVTVKPYHTKKQGNIVFIESVPNPDARPPESLKLLNFGNNVYYGKDFHIFVHLPGHAAGDNYTLKINRVDVSDRDTTAKSTVYSTPINGSRIYESLRPDIRTEDKSIYLTLASGGNAAYALADIPNRKFQSDIYQIQIIREGLKAPVAQSIFRSRWINMPTSLLNVDVAIDMLRFIVDDQTIKNLRSGSNDEKEKKFREFWSKRDPTPETEFNELMAEYYRRVDYAYEQFSTINVKGYNTDQGKIYIQYGPPNNIERKFPPGEPAVEIWNYGNRTFIFRAVSGFGQFELVSK